MTTRYDTYFAERCYSLRAENGTLVIEDQECRLALDVFEPWGELWFEIAGIEVAAIDGPNVWTRCEFLEDAIRRAAALDAASLELELVERYQDVDWEDVA